MQTSVDCVTLIAVLRPFSRVDRIGCLNIAMDNSGLKFQIAGDSIRLQCNVSALVTSDSKKSKKSKDIEWYAFPLKRFVDTLKGLTGEVLITLDENVLNISQGGKREFKLSGDTPMDIKFSGSSGKTISLKGELLRRGLGKAMAFVSENDMRPGLQGVRLLSENGQLVLCSSDGYTLCLFKMVCDDDLEGLEPCTIPDTYSSVLCELDTSRYAAYRFGDAGLGFEFDDGVIEACTILTASKPRTSRLSRRLT